MGQFKLYRMVSAIIQKEESVLLVKSGYENSANWGLPGGVVEGDESLEEAVSREVLEETGLKVLDMHNAKVLAPLQSYLKTRISQYTLDKKLVWNKERIRLRGR